MWDAKQCVCVFIDTSKSQSDMAKKPIVGIKKRQENNILNLNAGRKERIKLKIMVKHYRQIR